MQRINSVTWSSLIAWIHVECFCQPWEGTQSGASRHYLTCAFSSLSYGAVMGSVKFPLSCCGWETSKNDNCSSDWGNAACCAGFPFFLPFPPLWQNKLKQCTGQGCCSSAVSSAVLPLLRKACRSDKAAVREGCGIEDSCGFWGVLWKWEVER